MSGQAPAEREEDQRRALRAALRRAGMSAEELWLAAFALGAAAGPLEVEGYLEGLLDLPACERDVLAVAANERLDELAGTHRVPHSRPLRQPRPQRGPLAALVTLLEQQHGTGGLPAAAAAAGRALGVEMVVHVVDDAQRHLVALGPGQGERELLSVDGSLAGRAFRLGRAQTTAAGRGGHLWLPMSQGTQRLGVVQVLVHDAADLRDPVLSQHCSWAAALLAHLVDASSQRGDAVPAARAHRRRTPAGELVWNLLPPLSAGDERFALAGLVEPAHAVGGDVFDYALSHDRADLAVLDAMGHALGSGLIASAALAAYRSARRDGEGLYAQAAAVDEVVAQHFPSALATGVLASLDLLSGRLRYVAAGHPAPLVLREGRVVISLDAGRRTPFGLGTGELSVGETVLQRGDWLVLYTDGVVEARDARGQFFGLPRLVDLLERAVAAGSSPPESVRRLVHAVLDHQDDLLQDDATVLLARWHGPTHQEPPEAGPV